MLPSLYEPPVKRLFVIDQKRRSFPKKFQISEIKKILTNYFKTFSRKTFRGVERISSPAIQYDEFGSVWLCSAPKHKSFWKKFKNFYFFWLGKILLKIWINFSPKTQGRYETDKLSYKILCLLPLCFTNLFAKCPKFFVNGKNFQTFQNKKNSTKCFRNSLAKNFHRMRRARTQLRNDRSCRVKFQQFFALASVCWHYPWIFYKKFVFGGL